MKSAALKFIVFSLLFLVPLLGFLFLTPKKAFAACDPATWGWQIAVASISGNTVNYTITPNSGSGSQLVLTDLPIGNADREQTIPANVSSFSLNHPNGTHQAEVAFLGVCKSNDVSITLPSTGGPPAAAGCSTTAPTNEREFSDKIVKTLICNSDMGSEGFIKNQLLSTADGLQMMLMGVSSLHTELNPILANTGALAASGHMVAALYKQPPASGISYMAQEIQKLNPVQPTYAQSGGIGYDTLTPVQKVWENFRNIAYIGFVIVFVIIGFMIMFRAHISPQAVATVQDSLPRIVIALMLVTFSYAIAGFMIDIMFILLNVAITALPHTNANGNVVFTKSVFGVISSAWGDTFSTVFVSVKNVIDAVVSSNLSWLFKFVGGALVAVVVGIAMLFIMFKVFLMLLMAYATIIILTIAAPFFFLLQALPGNNSASSWFKQMAANIAVFPTVAIMFILAGYLGGIGALGNDTPAISSSAGNVQKFPLLAGDIDQKDLGRLVGIGILLMTPAAAEMVKNAIGSKSPGGGAAGKAAAGALAAGGAVMGAGPSSVGRYAGRQATEASAKGVANVGRGAWSRGTSALGNLAKRDGPGK